MAGLGAPPRDTNIEIDTDEEGEKAIRQLYREVLPLDNNNYTCESQMDGKMGTTKRIVMDKM
eukprot:5032767-Prorocentrum_lima.AAC.1